MGSPCGWADAKERVREKSIIAIDDPLLKVPLRAGGTEPDLVPLA
jgi:hypothetical protein